MIIEMCLKKFELLCGSEIQYGHYFKTKFKIGPYRKIFKKSFYGCLCGCGRIVIEFIVQSMPITTKVVSLNPTHGEVYSIQHYVIKFVSYFRQGMRLFSPGT